MLLPADFKYKNMSDAADDNFHLVNLKLKLN